MEYDVYRLKIDNAHTTVSTIYPDIEWAIGVSSNHALYLSATREGCNISVRFALGIDQLEGENLYKLAEKMAKLL